MNKGLFQESNGKVSAIRFIFVIGMIWVMVLTTIALLFLKTSVGEIVALFSACSGVFVGLKLGQKPMEKEKNDKKT